MSSQAGHRTFSARGMGRVNLGGPNLSCRARRSRRLTWRPAWTLQSLSSRCLTTSPRCAQQLLHHRFSLYHWRPTMFGLFYACRPFFLMRSTAVLQQAGLSAAWAAAGAEKNLHVCKPCCCLSWDLSCGALQDAQDIRAARRAQLPPLQSVTELTSAAAPPQRGEAPVTAQAAPSSAGAG